MNDDDDRDSGIADALRDLRGTPRTPDALEQRVVAALHFRGLLGRWRSGGVRAALGAVAAVSLFAAGFVAGSLREGPPAASRPRFVLFLHQGAVGDDADTSVAERVEEVRRWARALRDSGTAVTGEKLSSAEWTLDGRPDEPDGEPTRSGAAGAIAGYFVIEADDSEEALALARSCPHLRHGGTVSVRPIDPV